MLLTCNLTVFRGDDEEPQDQFFEVVTKQPGDRLLWVWYGEPSDTQMPGSGKKQDMLGFFPFAAIVSISSLEGDRFLVSYRGPKRTRGQLVLAPVPEDIHARGREEVIVSLHRMLDFVYRANDDEEEEDD